MSQLFSPVDRRLPHSHGGTNPDPMRADPYQVMVYFPATWISTRAPFRIVLNTGEYSASSLRRP